MAGKIQLTPAELLAQSQEMLSLQKDFEDLFKQTEGVLNQVNANWSENLANNFMGKLQSAQKAFSQITGMLGQGGSLAATSANTYESMDALLAKNVAGGLLQDIAGDIAGIVSGAVSDAKDSAGGIIDGIGDFLKEEWERTKEAWNYTGDFLEWANGKYQDVPEIIRKKIEGILGGQLTTSISTTYDIITGNVSWDTAENFLSEIVDQPYVDAIVGAFKYATNEEVQLRQAAYENAAIDYWKDGDVLAGVNTLVGSFTDTILVGSLDIGVDIIVDAIDSIPGVGLLEEVTGFDLSKKWDGWIANAHEGVGDFIESTSESIAEFEEGAQEFIGDVAEDVVETAQEVWSDAKDTYNDIKDNVGNAISDAKDTLGEMADAAGDAVGDFIDGFKFW